MSQRFVKGEYIIKEGEDGEYFYIIEEGFVICLKDIDDSTESKITVRHLTRGDHFGELALLKDIKRTMSV